MNSRWGRPLEPKGSLRSSGQNNINININFNALKDKPNIFGGKKIDNFIQISNQAKQNIARPNVSTQTLKQKKRPTIAKQQFTNDNQLKRKKSKSKFTQDVLTPQKSYKQRQSGNSRSIGKKSTQKRNSKSFDNLKKFYDRSSPKHNQQKQQKQSIPQYSKSNSKSRSKSKSRSQSNKKLTKINSKAKLGTNSTNSRAKNTAHNSKKQQQKISIQKTKKMPFKKSQKVAKVQQIAHIGNTVSRKPSTQRINRKKSTQEDPKKINRMKTPKKKRNSKQKQSKSLKRLPLFYQQQQPYDEQGSYKKMQKQVHQLLYNQQQQTKLLKRKQHKNIKHKQSPYIRYYKYVPTNNDLQILNQAAIAIQRIWRGYRDRGIFLNYINLQYHKNNITKNRIETKDPKFWDDAQSNSILKAQDDIQQSLHSSKPLSQLHSQIQKPIQIQKSQKSQKSANLAKNRIIQYDQIQMIERINKLQQYLKKQQQKAQKLQQQNKQLKDNLQKINTNQSHNNSYNQNNIHGNTQIVIMDSSQKTGQSGYGDQWTQIKNKHQDDPFLQEQNNNKNQQKYQQFQLRLPKKITNPTKKEKQTKPPLKNQRQISKKQQQQNLSQSQLSQQSQQSQKSEKSQKSQQSSKSNQFKKYKNKLELYQCSSPKYSQFMKTGIDKNLLQLFKRKQQQLKQNYQKKLKTYQRLQQDKIYSPQILTKKVTQLQQIFRKQKQTIRNKIQLVTQAAGVIKQIQQQQFKQKQPKSIKLKNEDIKKQIKPTIIKQNSHVIQDYGNMNLNSFRSKSQSQQQNQFQSSVQSDKSGNQSIFKRIQKQKANQINKQTQNKKLVKEIEQKNTQAIKIFNQISQYHIQQQKSIQKPPKLQYSQSTPKQQLQQQPPQQQYQQQIDQQQQQQPKKKYKGLQTTLLFIKQYCVSFVQFIRNSQQHKLTFIQNICKPIIYNDFDLLKSYRTTIMNQNQSSYNSQNNQYLYPYFKRIVTRDPTITIQAYNQFNSIYQKLQGECQFKEERDYFLLSLLQAFNQSLDYKRPCSIYGLPPAWISQSRALKNHYLAKQNIQQKQNFLKSQKFDQVCGIAISRVIEWSTSLCGFIPQSPQMQNVVIQQQQINHIRQTRIALMLEKDLLENQQNMLDFIIQQTQVKLQLGVNIMDDLIQQFIKEYYYGYIEKRVFM